jgi:hypothetical protein
MVGEILFAIKDKKDLKYYKATSLIMTHNATASFFK